MTWLIPVKYELETARREAILPHCKVHLYNKAGEGVLIKYKVSCYISLDAVQI